MSSHLYCGALSVRPLARPLDRNAFAKFDQITTFLNKMLRRKLQRGFTRAKLLSCLETRFCWYKFTWLLFLRGSWTHNISRPPRPTCPIRFGVLLKLSPMMLSNSWASIVKYQWTMMEPNLSMLMKGYPLSVCFVAEGGLSNTIWTLTPRISSHLSRQFSYCGTA